MLVLLIAGGWVMHIFIVIVCCFDTPIQVSICRDRISALTLRLDRQNDHARASPIWLQLQRFWESRFTLKHT